MLSFQATTYSSNKETYFTTISATSSAADKTAIEISIIATVQTTVYSTNEMAQFTTVNISILDSFLATN